MQLDFFLHDSDVYDVYEFLDIAPVSLAKGAISGPQYKLRGAAISIEADEGSGVATIWDYDVVIALVSFLAHGRKQNIQNQAREINPLPPHVFSSTATTMLKFLGRARGGKQYIDLELALDRLQRTRIAITAAASKSAKRLSIPSAPLIGGYRIVSRTSYGRIEKFEIDIPDWIYDSVVHQKNGIMPLGRAYFSLTPTARFIYRLARRTVRRKPVCYSISELHMRSGSRLPNWKFRGLIEDIVSRHGPTNPFPSYDLTLHADNDERTLFLRSR